MLLFINYCLTVNHYITPYVRDFVRDSITSILLESIAVCNPVREYLVLATSILKPLKINQHALVRDAIEFYASNRFSASPQSVTFIKVVM